MKAGLRRHANTHAAAGSDPITIDAIRFDVDNEGGYLLVVANDPLPASDDSIFFRANEDGMGDGGDLTMSAENIATLDADVEAQVTAPIVLLSGSGQSWQLSTSGTLIHINTGDTLVIEDGSNVALVTYTG